MDSDIKLMALMIDEDKWQNLLTETQDHIDYYLRMRKEYKDKLEGIRKKIEECVSSGNKTYPEFQAKL